MHHFQLLSQRLCDQCMEHSARNLLLHVCNSFPALLLIKALSKNWDWNLLFIRFMAHVKLQKLIWFVTLRCHLSKSTQKHLRLLLTGTKHMFHRQKNFHWLNFIGLVNDFHISKDNNPDRRNLRDSPCLNIY